MTVILGEKELKRVLSQLARKKMPNARRKAMAKTARALVQGIKKEIPTRYKDAKKAIGWRYVKQVGKGSRSRTVVKLGSAVGIKKSTQKQEFERIKAERKKEKKKGVGLGVRNLHWAILGTGYREIAKGPDGGGFPPPGWPTGKMPIIFRDLLKRGISRGDAILIEKLSREIRKELAGVMK